MSLSTGHNSGHRSEITSSYDQALDSLNNIPLFNTLEHDCLKLIALICQQIIFAPDEDLMTQGEEAEQAFYILSGEVDVLHVFEGTERRIKQFEGGAFIGGCKLLGKIQNNFTLRAIQKTTVLSLSRREFLKVLDLYPSSYLTVTKRLIAELVKWDKSMLARCPIDDENQAESGSFVCRPGVTLI